MQTEAIIESVMWFGKPSALYFDFRRVMTAFGHKFYLVQSVSEAKTLFETQLITTIVNALDLDQEASRLMIIEFRKVRPELKVIEGGSPLSRVVEDNFFALAHNKDGTITVDQFRQAIKGAKIRALASISWKMGVGVICIIGVGCLGQFSGSPLGKILSSFWSIVLGVEFVHLLFSSRKRFM